jgi:hypothetical protein
MPKIIGELRLYDLDELSSLLGMHKKSLSEKYIKTGVIRARKFGVRWYVSEEALKEYFSGTDVIHHSVLSTSNTIAQNTSIQSNIG